MNDDTTDYESYTRQHYRDTGVASVYARRLRWWRSPSEWAISHLEKRAVRAAVDVIAAGDLRLVVDVPAGTGKLTEWLSSRCDNYLALDISAEMLRQFGGTWIRAQADVTALPLRDGAADVVVVLRLLHRVPDEVAVAAIGEALRVAHRGVVVSYAGVPTSRGIHSAVRVVGRRAATRTMPHSPKEFATLVRSAGGAVVVDRSVSFGITAERVAAIARAPSS